MKRFRWQILFGSLLIVSSTILYFVHYFIFKDSHHIFIFMLKDIAFLPIEVLIVTMVIHRLLVTREKSVMLEKLNMVIGAFFSEVGTALLTYLSDFDPRLDKIRGNLIVTGDWSDKQFARVSKLLRTYDYQVEIERVELEDLRGFLAEKRGFLLGLLGNPSLLEHDPFTELTRAIFHLVDEFENREDLRHLPDSDCEHLNRDLKRVYAPYVHQWLDYMKHLKRSYPYFFSLAMRINPFDQKASAIVRQ